MNTSSAIASLLEPNPKEKSLKMRFAFNDIKEIIFRERKDGFEYRVPFKQIDDIYIYI